MSISNFDEQEVLITSVGFRNQQGSGQFESYPKRMVLEGREYTFVEQGMRYLIHKGQLLVKLFDVSDGQTLYRLRQDGQNHWTLVGMKTA